MGDSSDDHEHSEDWRSLMWQAALCGALLVVAIIFEKLTSFGSELIVRTYFPSSHQHCQEIGSHNKLRTKTRQFLKNKRRKLFRQTSTVDDSCTTTAMVKGTVPIKVAATMTRTVPNEIARF